MKATILLLLVSAAVVTCLAGDPQPRPLKSQPTAEQAKDALLRFIRANRTAFIGDPDPDKLARLPVKAMADGSYSLGAFILDPAHCSYSVSIGLEGPAPFFYSGSFFQLDGEWTATKPNVQHPLSGVPGETK